MKKQKTVIDLLVALLGFRTDPDAVERAEQKLRYLGRQVEDAERRFSEKLQAQRGGRQ